MNVVYSIMPMREWALPTGQICSPHAPLGRLIYLIFLLRTRPRRPTSSSPKPTLLIALLSISGGNAFASVATASSAHPTLEALKLPAKGSQSVMGHLDCNPDWTEILCAVEFRGDPSSNRAKSVFIPTVETRMAMEALGCTRFVLRVPR